MDAKEKKETINRVMHLLRSGKISSATPNKDVWKFFEFEENNGWTSVAKEMPPRREGKKEDTRYSIEVLTIDDCGFQEVDWFDFEECDWKLGEVEHITHWRHLPAPPKKKNGQGWVPASSGRPA